MVRPGSGGAGSGVPDGIDTTPQLVKFGGLVREFTSRRSGDSRDESITRDKLRHGLELRTSAYFVWPWERNNLARRSVAWVARDRRWPPSDLAAWA
jgi:hypothetical protein